MMNKRVMIIDDDKEFLEELSETLLIAGYDVLLVNNPVSAVDIVNKVKPDIILLDIRMPTKSGFQVANELNKYSGNKDIPIIGMTGFYRDIDISLMNICGIQKCLRKPFYPLDVIYQIENTLK